jgi:hypothetical protein
MRKMLAGHECTNAQQRGWGGVGNGEPIERAEEEFEELGTPTNRAERRADQAGGSILSLAG